MKKLIIAVLAASGAAIVYAQAETADERGRAGEFRAEMRALIAGDGMAVDDLANLLQQRSQARFTALDTNGDGIVTRDEFLAAADERAQARFERMGPDGDGVVTRSGREGWGRHHRGGPRAEGRHERPRFSAEERAERLGQRATEGFARIDTDGDGMISPQEFEAGLQARAERFAERRQDRREQRAGRQERMPEGMREMHAQLRAMMRDGMKLEDFSGLMRDGAGARFDALDADGNGELTAAEFTANIAEHAQRLFARMDRNSDRVVTGDDRPRWGGGWQRGGDGKRGTPQE